MDTRISPTSTSDPPPTVSVSESHGQHHDHLVGRSTPIVFVDGPLATLRACPMPRNDSQWKSLIFRHTTTMGSPPECPNHLRPSRTSPVTAGTVPNVANRFEPADNASASANVGSTVSMAVGVLCRDVRYLLRMESGGHGSRPHGHPATHTEHLPTNSNSESAASIKLHMTNEGLCAPPP